MPRFSIFYHPVTKAKITRVLSKETGITHQVDHSGEDGILTANYVYNNGDSENDTATRELDLNDVNNLIADIRNSIPFIEDVEPSANTKIRDRFVKFILSKA